MVINRAYDADLSEDRVLGESRDHKCVRVYKLARNSDHIRKINPLLAQLAQWNSEPEALRDEFEQALLDALIEKLVNGTRERISGEK